MDKEIIEFMNRKYKIALAGMIKKDREYNNGHAPMSYMPKGWASCYTYLNENICRMDSLMEVHEDNPDEIEAIFWDKWMDLLVYTLLSGKKMSEVFDKRRH